MYVVEKHFLLVKLQHYTLSQWEHFNGSTFGVQFGFVL